MGAGAFGEWHAKAIRDLPNARLVAASRTNAAALADFTGRFSGRGYADYEELLEDRDVDVVVIASPHHLHAEMAERAAQAGKPILLEKPMAHTLEECDRILDATRRARVGLMIGLLNHFVRPYRIAKQILDSGELGEVVSCISTMSKVWMDPNRRAWHLDRATGGGMWITSGVHCLDRMTWLMGSAVVQVYGQLDTRFHDQSADDVGMVAVKYANHAMGTVVSTGYRTGVTNHLTELTCTRGMMNIDYASGVKIGRDEVWQAVPDSVSPNWMHEALMEEWSAFLAAVEHGMEMPVTGEYGRAVMEVMFAVEESARTGMAVEIL